MKKLFSISFAMIILLSGMHLTIASHFCGGVVSATKFSISGVKASCGMDEVKMHCPAEKNFAAKSCCDDEVSVYAIDNNYVASSFQLKEVTQTMVHVLLVPIMFAFESLNHSNYCLTNVSPPDKILASNVILAGICVFRI